MCLRYCIRFKNWESVNFVARKQTKRMKMKSRKPIRMICETNYIVTNNQWKTAKHYPNLSYLSFLPSYWLHTLSHTSSLLFAHSVSPVMIVLWHFLPQKICLNFCPSWFWLFWFTLSNKQYSCSDQLREILRLPFLIFFFRFDRNRFINSLV